MPSMPSIQRKLRAMRLQRDLFRRAAQHAAQVRQDAAGLSPAVATPHASEADGLAVCLYEGDGGELYITLANSPVVWRVRMPRATAFAHDAARLLAGQTCPDVDAAPLSALAELPPIAVFDGRLSVEEKLGHMAQQYVYGDTYD